MPPLIALLVLLLVVLIIVWACFFIIDGVGAPYPLGMLAKAIVAVIAIYALYSHGAFAPLIK